MKENNKIIIAQANALTQSRYDFNVIEKRCLYQIIREVRRLYIDSNTGQRDLFDNMCLTLTPTMLEGLVWNHRNHKTAICCLRF